VADSILKTRPPLTNRLVLRSRQPLRPDTKYIVELRGVRSAGGVASAETRQVLALPKAPEVKPDSVAKDSTRSDSLKVRGDTLPLKPVTLPADAPRPKNP
jgi:hypothetical protein